MLIVLLLVGCGGSISHDQSSLIHDTRVICEENPNIACIEFVIIADDYDICQKNLPWWDFLIPWDQCG